MIDATTITAGISGIKFIGDALKLKKEIVGDDESKEKISAALDKLDDTRGMVYDLRDELMRIQEENASLKSEVSDFKRWDDILNDYETIKTDGGAVVYQKKSDHNFYICPSCTNEKRIEFLQTHGNGTSYHCSKCDGKYQIFEPPKHKYIPVKSSRRSRY